MVHALAARSAVVLRGGGSFGGEGDLVVEAPPLHPQQGLGGLCYERVMLHAWPSAVHCCFFCRVTQVPCHV